MDAILRSRYDASLQHFRHAFSRYGAYTCIVLIILAAGFDAVVYPDNLSSFGIARLAAVAAIFLTIQSIDRLPSHPRHVAWLTLAWLLVPQMLIAWMIAVTDGPASPYALGLHLAIYASGIALPFGVWQSIVFGILTYALYLAACLWHTGPFDTKLFTFHSLLLLFSMAIGAVYTYFNERGRMTLFKLQTELADKNKALADIKLQMLQQEKMAAIGTLAAGLLHEVNNPLNFCMMAAEAAASEPAVKSSLTATDCIADLRQGMRRIHHIVSDLKGFAYRKPGDTSHSPFLLEQAIDSARRLTAHELKGIEVMQNMPRDTLVLGDEGAIVGVLINLLGNAALALHSVERDPPIIHIAARWKDKRLFLTVADNGPGIAPENLQRVFEPFFTTRDVGQGLGLGLSICYRTIEQHGGTLIAESVFGKCAEMRFDLPRPD